MADLLQERHFITVSELARLMQCDPRTVRRGIKDGSIPAVRVGSTVRVPVPAVRRMLELEPHGGAVEDDEQRDLVS